MKNWTIAASSVLGACLLAVGMTGAAWAKPAKPLNAATTESGTGCLVRDADGNYHADADCAWHVVVKRDKDGNLLSFKYQDKGSLPEGAPRPSSALKVETVYPGCPAGANEITLPSGEYSSDCHYRSE